MKYLVCGSKGPKLATSEEVVSVLEESVLAGFEYLMKLEKEKKILAGGLPIGGRAFVFIVEAASNEELDQMLRRIPFWGILEWEVTALQTFAGREVLERNIFKELKK